MALPHSPEEKEMTEGDHERALRQLIETTPIAIDMRNYAKQNGVQTTGQPSCTTGISSIEFLLLTNLMGDYTAPLVAQQNVKESSSQHKRPMRTFDLMM